ncbi:ATP-binding protein [Lactobacillus acidophilus]|nr:ATP-binding protein [Lactobacillus acidophilus]AZN77291.1 ATP-binding protein [Lactobacillus acidophilus]
MKKMINKNLGVIVSVDGSISQVGMYELSNDPQILWEGDLLNGPKVGALLTILQNDVKIIAKVTNEKIIDQQNSVKSEEFDNRYRKNSVNRIVSLKTQGIIEDNQFKVTSSYVPMIGNEVTITSKEDIDLIYGVKKNAPTISIGKTIFENKRLNVPINELFASHIGIFGNTGSGKSNTLHKLYLNLFNSKYKDGIFAKSKFFIFDFNGEYRGDHIFGLDKNNRKIINLNTRTNNKSAKVFINKDTFLDSDILTMLFDAKSGTQAPFLLRALKRYKTINNDNESIARLEVGLLKTLLSDFKHTTPNIEEQWIDVFEKYLYKYVNNCTKGIKIRDELNDLSNLVKAHSTGNISSKNTIYFKSGKDSFFYKGESFSVLAVTFFTELIEITKYCLDQCNEFAKLKIFLAFQMIYVTAWNNKMSEYLGPLFNRILNVLDSLEKTIEVSDTVTCTNFYRSVNIISFVQCDLTTKRIIPMLIAKMLYNQQKAKIISDNGVKTTTHLIIDEAHNILGSVKSKSDFWQNKRLSAFEEIIKEGRKFGFFLTIASQRPADISPTIMSQLHNFFVHRLVNDKDLAMVENTMPTLDKTAFDMIPSLGQGEAVLTGKAFPISIFTKIDHAAKDFRPKSDDVILTNIWNDIE